MVNVGLSFNVFNWSHLVKEGLYDFPVASFKTRDRSSQARPLLQYPSLNPGPPPVRANKIAQC